jgi:hypothetical protein
VARIFYSEGSDGGSERELELLDDGTLLYSESPNRYAHMRGVEFSSRKLTVAEAKKEWPQYATEIDEALKRRS